VVLRVFVVNQRRVVAAPEFRFQFRRDDRFPAVVGSRGDRARPRTPANRCVGAAAVEAAPLRSDRVPGEVKNGAI